MLHSIIVIATSLANDSDFVAKDYQRCPTLNKPHEDNAKQQATDAND
jgi:hypothetical protein